MSNQQEFINKLAPLVQKYAPKYNILCNSAVIAQACVESAYGESVLSAKYNNYFGLKCGTKWKGQAVNMQTQEEYTTGTYTSIVSDFRVYGSMEEGVQGYFDFIQLDRYGNLKGVKDPLAYLTNIKNDGFATSSTYVDTCMKVVNQWHLTQYDSVKTPPTRETIVNQAQEWVGLNEADGTFKPIIDLYNTQTVLPRGYKVQYTDAWCAAFVTAVAIACDATDIIPAECSCYYQIQGFKDLDEWQEDDSYVPSPGDIIYYDWQDTGTGDNTGYPDHVGIVESCAGGKITAIEGNKSDAVGRRVLDVNGRYIRGFGLPKYSDDTITTAPAADTSAEQYGVVLAIRSTIKEAEAVQTVLQECGIDTQVCKVTGCA